MSQVKIGPSFFAKAKADYSNWRFALAREFIQNSIDARANHIQIAVNPTDEGDTRVTISDNGCGMSEDVLVNKLLALGESGKEFEETVGGFGKAKEILYFCHKSYDIETNNLRVHGSGGDYDFIVGADLSQERGTRSEIVIEGDEVDDILGKFHSVINMTQWRGKFTVNGEEMLGRLKKGAFRKELSWCKIYTNKSFGNRLIVRIGGIVMFRRYVDADNKCVLIELKGTSGDVLQSSRDGLQYDYATELDELIRRLTVDKRSAFRPDTTYYEHWEGSKLENVNMEALPEILKIREELIAMSNDVAPVENDEERTEQIESPDRAANFAPVESAARVAVPAEEVLDVAKLFRHDFVLKNNSAMQIPNYYRPGHFSAYADKLVRCWVRLLLETYRTFGQHEPFSVGFIFEEDDVWAEYEKGKYGLVYYINPAKVTRGYAQLMGADVRVFKKRWGFTWSMKYHLIVTAVHEYVHSQGFGVHDERFVQKSDECMAVVMKNIKRFRACFG